jgi:hypothetical protein
MLLDGSSPTHSSVTSLALLEMSESAEAFRPTRASSAQHPLKQQLQEDIQDD